MKYKIPLYFLIVLPLLLVLFAAPFAIPPLEVAEAKKTTDLVKIGKESILWTTTSIQEDDNLNIFVSQVEQYLLKVELTPKVELKANYRWNLAIEDVTGVTSVYVDEQHISKGQGIQQWFEEGWVVFEGKRKQDLPVTFYIRINEGAEKFKIYYGSGTGILMASAAGSPGEHYYQRHSWYVEGRHWLFYSDGSDAYVNSSADGTTGWVSEKLYDAANVLHTMHMDAHYNGTHFFVILIHAGEGMPWFRMGDPASDGSISWETGVWQRACPNEVTYNTAVQPSVTADSEGYPVVTWQNHEYAVGQGIWCNKAAVKDGSWSSHASGFPYRIMALNNVDSEGRVIALPSQDLYVIYSIYSGVDDNQSRLTGRYYDFGTTTWASAAFVTDHNVSHGYEWSWSVVDDSIYIGYNNASDNYGMMAIYNGSSWGTDEDITESAIVNAPSMVRRQNGDVWFVWGDSNKKIWSRYYDGTTWLEKHHITTEQVFSGGEASFERLVATPTPKVGYLYWGSDLYFDVFALNPLWGVSITVDNKEGCGDWVFANEIYYHFNATWLHEAGTDMFDTVKIAFTDGYNWMNVSYDVVEAEFAIDSGSDQINLRAGTVQTAGNELSVTFDIYFESAVLDAEDIEGYMWASDTDGEDSDWELVETDFISIYNLGGQFSVLTSGDAGRLTGGDTMELYAYNNSWAQTNMTFRKLQHEHFYVRVYGNKVQWDTQESDPWNVTFGMYVCPDDEEFIEAWKVVLSLVAGETWIEADPGPGSDAFYITWYAKWYNRDTATADWDLINTDTFTSLPIWNGTDTVYTALWVDLWFNEMNASTIFGGRVNSEYYGISDSSEWFAFWAQTWGAYVGNVTQSMYFDDLENTAGEIISARQLKMMKPFFRVEQGVNAARNNTVEIRDFDILDFREAEGKMEGVPTPIFVASKMPDMPSTGFLAGVVAAFGQIGNTIVSAISYGALQGWNILVQFLDTVGSWLGFPNAFTNFTAYLTEFFSFLANAMANLGTMMTEVFTFFLDPVVKMLTYIGLFFSNILTTLTTMVNVVTGVYGWSTDLFDYFNLADFITLFFVFTVPIMMLQVFKNEGIGGIWRITSTFLDILSFFISLFIRIANFVIGILVAIVEAIPLVE